MIKRCVSRQQILSKRDYQVRICFISNVGLCMSKNETTMTYRRLYIHRGL